jgi:hypothetical protein
VRAAVAAEEAVVEVLGQVVEQLVGLGLREPLVLHGRVEVGLHRIADHRLDRGVVLPPCLGDVLQRRAAPQAREELRLGQPERLGGRVEHRGRPAMAEGRPAAEATVGEARPARPGMAPAEHEPALGPALLDRVGLFLREAARLHGGGELVVLRLRERVAQLGRLDAEALGRVVEDGLLALLGVVAAGGGERDAGPAGRDHAGRGDGCDASALHVASLTGSDKNR